MASPCGKQIMQFTEEGVLSVLAGLDLDVSNIEQVVRDLERWV